MGMFLLAGMVLWPALLWAVPSADAQVESPTCDQYSACEKGAPLEATAPATAASTSVAPEESSLERMASATASASASPEPPSGPDDAGPPESDAPVADGTPPEEAEPLAVEDSPIGVSASASAGAPASAAPTSPAVSPPPVVPPTSVASPASAGGPAVLRDESLRSCRYVLDEDERLEYKNSCHLRGGSDIGKQAGDDAQEAEETLNGGNKSPSPVGPGSVTVQLLGEHQGGNESAGRPHEPSQGGNPHGGLAPEGFEGSPELAIPRPESRGSGSGPPSGRFFREATPAQAAPKPRVQYYLARGNAADGEGTDSAKGSSLEASGTGARNGSTGGSLLTLFFRPIADSVLPSEPAVSAVERFVPGDAPPALVSLGVNATAHAQSREHDGRSPVLADAAGPAERSASASSPSAEGSAEVPSASPGPAVGAFTGAGDSGGTDGPGGLRGATGGGAARAAALPDLVGRAAEGVGVGRGRTYAAYGVPAFLLGGLGSVAALYTVKRRSRG